MKQTYIYILILHIVGRNLEQNREISTNAQPPFKTLLTPNLPTSYLMGPSHQEYPINICILPPMNCLSHKASISRTLLAEVYSQGTSRATDFAIAPVF